MSQESLDKFMGQVADSEDLQAKLGEEIDAESLIALGAECGCEFTSEDLQESADLRGYEGGRGRWGIVKWRASPLMGKNKRLKVRFTNSGLL